MWARTTNDPLGRLLFEKYGMHLLSRPRENVSVFEVFAVRGGKVVRSGTVDAFLRVPFAKPAVTNAENLLDIESTVSHDVSVGVSLDFLRGFLALIGAGAMKAVTPALEQSRDRELRFKFGGCTRNYVTDGFELALALNDVAFRKETSAMEDGYRYYLASGVHRCNALAFEIADKNRTKVDLSAEVAAVGGAKAGLAIDRERQITATSDKNLAYGVELNEIVYNEKRRRLDLAESKDYLHVRAGAADLPRATIGAADDLMMLDLADDPRG